MTTRRQVLQTAASHIGYTEKRTKRYPNGNYTKFWVQMETALGLHQDALQGQPWCAAYVNSVLIDNGIDGLLRGGPGLPFYTPSMEGWARDEGIWHDSIDLQPGDVLIFTEAKTIHTGFLERQIDAHTVQTIEGNTSPGNGGSQANGGGVYRRRRNRSWVRGGIDMSRFYAASAPVPVGRPLPLIVDGEMGPATARAWQWYLKQPQTGALSRMDKRELQSWVGNDRTGVLSRGDVRDMQSKLGLGRTGLWDAELTGAMQRFLNRRIADPVKPPAKPPVDPPTEPSVTPPVDPPIPPSDPLGYAEGV